VDLPLSNECKRVLAYAAEEAQRLAHKHIGTEHLFLGLMREEKCFAAQLLRECGADLNRVRKELATKPPQRPTVEEETAAREEIGRGIHPHIVRQPPETHDFVKKVGFQAYTEEARRAIFFARYEASQFGSPYIESEHFLLGLLREDKTYLALTFLSLPDLDSLRAEIKSRTLTRKDVSSSVDLPLSNECRRALAYGAEEAERLGKAQIGTEHLLLGLLREVGCFGAQLLLKRGADVGRIRKELSTPPD
jgi:ATP-dependent Clp protease ATP-binding subunit ClpA